MLRVLQIVAAPCPNARGEFGVNGPERRAANVVHLWREKQVEPIILYPKRGKMWDIFAGAGVRLIDFEIRHKFNFSAIGKICRIIAEQKADVLHTQGPGSLDLLAVVAAKRSGKPLIVTRPSMIEQLLGIHPLRRKIYAFLDRFTLNVATRVVAVSRAGRHHLSEVTKVPESKLRLIYNGIDLKKFRHEQKQKESGKEECFTIGMVAQLTPLKGWEDFLEVICRLHRNACAVRALVVGDGPLRFELEEKARALGISEQVVFTGHVEDVSAIYRKMDVLLFTSYREGLSVAILEALASALPVVATEVGGIHEQVMEGGNGFVLKTGDIEGMAQCCRELMGKPLLRAQFGKFSRQRAEALFDEKVMVEQYAGCYREAVAVSSQLRG